MSLQALHKASKAEIEAITLAHHRTTWNMDQTPRKYRATAIPDEEPVIPGPRVFLSLTDPLVDRNDDSQSGQPSIGECATHLELLKVFKLRSDILHCTYLDTVFGIKQEHRVVYQSTSSWRKRGPVKLKDTNWDEKRRKKWEYIVSLSVARFELWAEKAGSTVTGDSEALQLPYGTLGSNDIYHHMSLEVDFTGLDDEYRIPRLYVRRWISGLCFFKVNSRNDVTFPWRASLETIVP